ncbi:MAG TPA: hypothetical protein VF624_18835 [Tepidisphaeraceae bacterium]|jgi:hypothetical protein
MRYQSKYSGNDMAPLWLAGDLIEFEDVDPAAIEPGRDYYVETATGATFKRCVHVDAARIIVGSVTEPAECWAVERSRIVRVGRAVGVLAVRDG